MTFRQALSTSFVAGLRRTRVDPCATYPVWYCQYIASECSAANDVLDASVNTKKKYWSKLMRFVSKLFHRCQLMSYLLKLRSTFADCSGDGYGVSGMGSENCCGGQKPCAKTITSYALSVRGGIHGSTEYGKLSIRAHMPRMDE